MANLHILLVITALINAVLINAVLTPIPVNENANKILETQIQAAKEENEKVFNAMKVEMAKESFSMKLLKASLNGLAYGCGQWGAPFAFAASMLDDGGTAMTNEIREGFRQINLRFDETKQMIENLQTHTDMEDLRKEFRDQMNSLDNVENEKNDFNTLLTPNSLRQLREQCGPAAGKPEKVLTWFNTTFKRPDQANNVVEKLFKTLKYNRREWQAWSKYIILSALRAITLDAACLAVSPDVVQADMDHHLKKYANITNDVADELIRYEDKMSAEWYDKQLETDMLKWLIDASDAQAIANNLYTNLKNKYVDIQFNVHVLNNVAALSTQEHLSDKKHFKKVQHPHSQKVAVVNWWNNAESRKDSLTPAQYVEKIKPEMNGFQCTNEEGSDEAYQLQKRVDKYFVQDRSQLFNTQYLTSVFSFSYQLDGIDQSAVDNMVKNIGTKSDGNAYVDVRACIYQGMMCMGMGGCETVIHATELCHVVFGF